MKQMAGETQRMIKEPELYFRNILCFLLSFFLRMNVDGLHKNFHHISKFPDHYLIDHQFSGQTLFIAGSKSDFVR